MVAAGQSYPDVKEMLDAEKETPRKWSRPFAAGSMLPVSSNASGKALTVVNVAALRHVRQSPLAYAGKGVMSRKSHVHNVDQASR